MKNYSAKFHFLRHGSVINVEDAAEYLECSPRRVRKLLQEKRLSGAKQGKKWVVNWPLDYAMAARGPVIKIARRGLAAGYQKRHQ